MDTSIFWSQYVQGIHTLYTSRLLRFHERFDAQYRPLFSIDGAERILEIGCGPGALAGTLCRMYPTAAITGIDRDQTFISFAEEHVPGAAFLTGDAAALPFADGSFDVTISNTVSEHIEPAAFFGEQYRVLRNGGVCIVLSTRRGITVPTPESLLTEVEKRFWDKAETLPDPIREYVCQYPLDVRDLPVTMEKHGFQELRSGYITIALTPDDPEICADIAHAIIDADRYCALESAESFWRTHANTISESEWHAVKAAIMERFNRRTAQYDHGERLWDTSVTLIQVVRGVKRANEECDI